MNFKKKLIRKLERLTENKDVVAKSNCNDFLKKIMFDFYKIYDSHSYLFSDISELSHENRSF